ncbi:MAG: extracellular solute-binding protein [Solirubrobacterales bacterium]
MSNRGTWGRKGTGAAVVLVGLSLVLFAGCGSDNGRNELTWFIAIQPGGSIQKIAETCSKESGGKYDINLELLPSDASQQREQLVRRLGAEDSSIDIIGMDVVWTAEFANAGWIEPWEGADARQVTKNVFPPVIESATFEKKLYGAPLSSNTQLLWYRKDLVPEVPKTWDEMIDMAEKIGGGKGGKIQVQGSRYEGYTAWVNAMIESAGTRVLSGPDEVDLAPGPTEAGIKPIGRLARSSAAPANLSTSDEDSARLGFESGSAFMVNYTFAYGSAKENAPDIAKQMGAARYPGIDADKESKPPLGGFNLAVSEYSEKPELARQAIKCLTSPKQQLVVTELDGLSPPRANLYSDPAVKKAFPGFSGLIKNSIETAGPRPVTPAYQDVSLAIQSALHPPDSINPDDISAAYEKLKDYVERGVKRKGLL